MQQNYTTLHFKTSNLGGGSRRFPDKISAVTVVSLTARKVLHCTIFDVKRPAINVVGLHGSEPCSAITAVKRPRIVIVVVKDVS